MPTEAAVLAALRPSRSPSCTESIVELGMVKGVAIDGGRWPWPSPSPWPGCPLKPEITRRVSEAVQPLDGIEPVEVDLREMDDEQRRRVAGAPPTRSTPARRGRRRPRRPG